MKKLLLALVAIMSMLNLSAQDIDVDKLIRKADRSLAKYNMDQSANFDELEKAKGLVMEAFKSDAAASNAEALVVKGQVYDAFAGEDIKQLLLDPNASMKYPDAPFQAYEAYKKALNFADKSKFQRQAIQGLQSLTQPISNIGNQYLGQQAYDKAYKPMSMLLEINNLLVKNKEDAIFPEEKGLNQQKYIVAICAMQAGDMPRSKEILEELVSKKYEEPAIYSTLFDVYSKEGNQEKALNALQTGKELFPDDNKLLFAEINYYISNKQTDKLEGVLKKAIEAEPDNPSVRTALGNVYMQLMSENAEAGNEAQAQTYKEKAIDYFEQAIELDPKAFEAQYSIGSIYFNRAAALTQEMSNLGMSKEDQKKYSDLEKETKMLFDKALPYFKIAEKINPSDMNTLIALKEIFARTNQFEISNIFKQRMAKVKAGETIENSYFEAQGE